MSTFFLFAILVLGSIDEPTLQASASSAPAGKATASRWWQGLGDPALAQAVDVALAHNQDLAQMQARLQQARALVIESLAPLLPTAAWNTGINMGPSKSLGFQFGGGLGSNPMAPSPPTLFYTFSSTANASLPFDITGRNVLQNRAAKREVQATQLDQQARRQAIANQVARTYTELVAARAQLRVVTEQVATNQALLDVLESRFNAGQISSLDVLQQRVQLQGTQALVPQAAFAVTAGEQQLRALLANDEAFANMAVQDTFAPLPAYEGVDNEEGALASRPDVRAAEQRVTIASERLKVQKRTFAPTLNATGQGGVQGIRIFDWRTQWFWGAGLMLSVPLSTGGLTRSRLDAAKAQRNLARAQADALTIQTRTALVRARAAESARKAARDTVAAQYESAQALFREAREQYLSGVAEYINVLSALASMQQVQVTLIVAERDLLLARIDRHAAAGSDV